MASNQADQANQANQTDESAGKIESRTRMRPLLEMDVAIPEPGQDKPPVQIDLL